MLLNSVVFGPAILSDAADFEEHWQDVEINSVMQ